MNIGHLEKKLLKVFRKKYACDWDNTGLLVGDAKAKVEKIAVALDATPSAIKYAEEKNCNLLITHHPSFLKAPDRLNPGKNVYDAISSNIALMNFHTALDVSPEGAAVLPELLNLKMGNVLCPVDGKHHAYSSYGFGRICTPKGKNKIYEKYLLKNLVNWATEVFGRRPRVWGDVNKKLKKIVTTTGSAGSLDDKHGVLQACIDKKIDCLVCGEIKYHDALELSERGVCIVDLGHDVSELPLTSVIISQLVNLGFSKNDIILVPQDDNWF